MEQPTKRYDLSDLLEIVSKIDTSTSTGHINSTDMQNLKQHSSLCTALKHEEVIREQNSLSVITGSNATLNSKGLVASSQPIRPPVSRFARNMWPERTELGSRASGIPSINVTEDVETMETRDVKVIDFAVPQGERESSTSPDFATARDRQLYYRPREWRRRKRGEWADTGPCLCPSSE